MVVDENSTQRSIPCDTKKNLERDSANSDQHMKTLMSLREGLYVMMQCYLRQHNAERDWLHEHPGRFAA